MRIALSLCVLLLIVSIADAKGPPAAHHGGQTAHHDGQRQSRPRDTAPVGQGYSGGSDDSDSRDDQSMGSVWQPTARTVVHTDHHGGYDHHGGHGHSGHSGHSGGGHGHGR